MRAAKVGLVLLGLLIALRFCAHAQLSPYPMAPSNQAVAPQLLPPPPGYPPAPPGYYPPSVMEIPPAPQAPPQYVAPAPPVPPPVVAPQPEELSTTLNGRVRRYILTPSGEVEGLELDDGTDVRFPPHVGDSVVKIVRPGDIIAVNGEPPLVTPYGRVIKALAITNLASRQTVVDEPPRGRRLPRWARRMWMRRMSTSGSVERYVLNPHGDVDGIFLNNGVEIKFPPHVGREIAMLAQPGRPSAVEVSGDGTSNAYGTVIDAPTGSLIINGTPVSFDRPPGPIGKRGPRF